MTNPTLYDEVLYPTGAQPTCHPDRLAMIATLMGMSPAPITRCRVLEIGCGDASNLIPLAFHLPDSRFTGFDLAEKPIAAGKEVAAAIGVKNLTLEAKNLMSVTPEYGEFDYIIAHGLYAWLPAPVQDKLVEICRANLAPQGVAFVSYNAYPGSLLKQAVRDMLSQFIPKSASLPETLKAARSLLDFAATRRAETRAWGPTMVQMAKLLGDRPETALAHDELGEHYRPAYFHEFAAHAARHGLQFLGEANYTDMSDRWLLPEEREFLARLEGDPVLLREQYMDFLKLRTFRNTLLCRKEVCLDRDGAAAATLKLLVSSRLRPISNQPDLDTDHPERFEDSEGGMTVSIVGIKRMLARLAAAWPQRIPAAELVSKELPADQLGELLLAMTAANMAALQTHCIPYVTRVGERPVAALYARSLAAHRSRVTSLEHNEVVFQDPVTRRLVMLLDGTRDRAAILAELRKIEPTASPELLEQALALLGDMALLTA